MTATEPTLRDRLVSALQAAAFLCDDDCTLKDEAACDAAHPIQATCLHFDQVADIAGPIDDIADVALAVVQPELDAKDTEIGRLSAALARVDEEIAEFVFAADADPNTPAACLHMIKLLRLARAEEP